MRATDTTTSFDDDAGLDHIALAVDQQRELAQRPALQPVGAVLRLLRPEAAELERRGVLVEGDQHLLRVRRKRVTVEHEGHGNLLDLLPARRPWPVAGPMQW